MNTKKIYLIRHGETDYNLKGIVQGGGVDTSLNETGINQARAFHNFYKDIKFDKIYTSKLKRSIQSVQQFIDSGIPHESYRGLNEISWGSKDGKIVTAEENTLYWKIISQWKNGEVHVKIDGGESPFEIQQMQKEVFEIIFSRPEEKTILVCMHGRAIRILLTTLLNYDLKCMDEFPHNNLGLYLLNYTGSMCSVDKFNDTSHLIL